MERLRQLIHEMHRRTERYRLGFVILGLMFAGASGPLSAQTDDDALLGWARENGIPLTTVEPGRGFADLQALRPLIGEARVVALGEPVHGAHEPLALRNRLFEFLVEDFGFTAIAVETGFTEAWAVDDYVNGRTSDAEVAVNVFHWGGQVWVENLQLINWIRDYNARPSTTRPVRFYGVDLSGGRQGLFRTPHVAVDAALAYLDRVDSALADQFRRDLADFMPRFNEADYPTMQVADRNALTATLSDLLIVLERDRLAFIDSTGAPEYQRAYREAFVALRLDANLRAVAANPDDWRLLSVRDEAMASNLKWVLEQEGDEGRVFLFAHNGHVKTSPVWPNAYPEFYPDGRPDTSMGEYLRPDLGDDMVVIGTSFGGGERRNGEMYERADPASVDGLLGRIGSPLVGLDLRSSAMPVYARDQLRMYRRVRVNDRYGELDVTTAFDALIYLDELSPVERPPR